MLWLKHLHVTCVVLSFSLFFVRGVWMARGTLAQKGRLWRILPHGVDTVLLGSALGLAYTLDLNPMQTPWLAAKLLALLVYILLGSVALRRGRTVRVRLAAWFAAQAVFLYIVGAAVRHDPLSWFA